MKRGRKTTNRKSVIYCRVKTENAKWFKGFCKQKKASYCETLDTLFEACRAKDKAKRKKAA